MTFKLGHPKQCATCPWKKSTTVENIPKYEVEKHQELSETIADMNALLSTTKNMACHYDEGEGRYCIGWLSNQLGPGNNIPLRMRFMQCENVNEIQLDGEQVSSFEETFE